MRQPPTNKRVRDRDGNLWRSWTDGLGDRWWALVDNGDAEPLTWRQLERLYAPLTVV